MDTKKRLYDVAGCLMAGILAAIICCVSLRIWEIDLTTLPGDIGGDGTLACFLFKSIQQNGIKGVFVNHMVGAPDVSYLIDVPFYDVNLLVLAYVVNFLTQNYIVTYYVIYVLGYSLSAITMYILLSRFQLQYWVKVVFSVLFAIAPYHFLRSMGHITLANYVTIPIGVYLAFVILEDEFTIFQRVGGKRKLNRRSVLALLAAIFVGNGQLYYAFFLLIVMALALLMKIIQKRTIRPLLYEGSIIYMICFFVLLGIAPKIIFGKLYGENTLAGVRVPMEAELYGMKIIQLLLPVPYTRIPFLGKANWEYAISGVSVTENAMASLGVIASCCFVFLCGWLIYSFISKQKDNALTARMDFLALGTLVMVLYCTVGGIGAIFNYLVTPQIRALNRASILIACMVLTAGALVIDRIRKRTVSVIACIMILLMGMYDQVLVYSSGWQDQAKVSQDIYEDFFAEVEESVEEGTMIYELPFMNFPESPAQHRMLDYTPFAGYLFTDTLRWSYGGVIGRNSAAAELYVDGGRSIDFVTGIEEAGFVGVCIDSYGYADNGSQIVEFYRDLGFEEIVSSDQRFYFFKL